MSAYQTTGKKVQAVFVYGLLGIAWLTGTASGLSAALIEHRSIDGKDNHMDNSAQGAAGTALIRFNYDPFFPDDGSGATMTQPPERANARVISNALSAQSQQIPNRRGLSDFIWQWGQFLTHDVDLTPTNPSNGIAHIPVPTGDPHFDPGSLGNVVIPFHRSNFVAGTGTPGTPREQVNDVTSYIDASNVYGSDTSRAQALRTMSGGKLKMSINGLLPLNNDPNGIQPNDNNGPVPDQELFLAGDVRANEQPGLTAMHTIFSREHNRLADLIAIHNPTATDEQIYQTARKIVGAEMQAITYNEFLPALMGDLSPNPRTLKYRTSVDASITQSFAHALFRFGHSMGSSTLKLVNSDGSVETPLALRDGFFNPNFLKNDPDNVDRILYGLASQVAEENDLAFVDEIRNFLFGPPGAGGLDLMALDIQRGRDHGLPSYNETRRAYFLPEVLNVLQITEDTAVQQALADLYDLDLNPTPGVKDPNIENIDVLIGALAEDHMAGSSLGETLFFVIGNQFTRLREGDRFFYLDDPDLYDLNGDLNADIAAIIDLDSVTLSAVIKRNTGITRIQNNVFFVPEPTTAWLLTTCTGCLFALRRRRHHREHAGYWRSTRAFDKPQKVYLSN